MHTEAHAGQKNNVAWRRSQDQASLVWSRPESTPSYPLTICPARLATLASWNPSHSGREGQRTQVKSPQQKGEEKAPSLLPCKFNSLGHRPSTRGLLTSFQQWLLGN